MKKIWPLLACLCWFHSQAQFFSQKEPFAHTYSIVARDVKTGELGVAVQSHWFGVGAVVCWAEAGVGAIATQAMVNKSYGPMGLQLMKDGIPANEALDRLLRDDQASDIRQVAMIDARGVIAAHTGSQCIDFADHYIGENFSVQSNMMLNNTVTKAMSKSFQQNDNLPLAERMLAALEAAQAAGGDIRGQQSAAILIVPGKSSGRPWDDRLVDLRVDDHAAPLAELKRLLKVHRAYEHMNNGDLAMEKNDMAGAMDQYNKAMKMFPENQEMQYWTAITLANNKKLKEAAEMLQKIYLKDKNWRELTRRLSKVGMLNASPENLKLLLQ